MCYSACLFSDTENTLAMIISELWGLSYKIVTEKNISIISLKIKMLITLFFSFSWQKVKTVDNQSISLF